jgi:hypothetical protein
MVLNFRGLDADHHPVTHPDAATQGPSVLFGQPSLAGFYVLFVLPLSLAVAGLTRRCHREVLDEAGLTLPRRGVSRASAVLGVQAVQAPLAVWAYLRELQELRDAEGRDVTRIPHTRPHFAPERDPGTSTMADAAEG